MSTRLVLPAYLGFVAMVLATASWLVQSSSFAERPQLLAWAISLDIAGLVPLVYLLLAHRMRWPRLTAVPVFVLAVIVGHQILPPDQPGALRALELAAIPLELGIVGYLIWRVRRFRSAMRRTATGAEDFVESVETVLRSTVRGDRVVQIAVTEMSILFYAFAGWRGRADRPGGFSYHVRNGYVGVALVFVFLVVVETVALHLFLMPRIPLLAWVLLALSVYGTIYLLGDLNAARCRPLRVEDGLLRMRTGLRWRAEIPLSDLISVEARRDTPSEGRLLSAPLVGETNVVLRFGNPIQARGIYGMNRRVDALALAVDDVPGFLAALSPDSRPASTP